MRTKVKRIISGILVCLIQISLMCPNVVMAIDKTGSVTNTKAEVFTSSSKCVENTSSYLTVSQLDISDGLRNEVNMHQKESDVIIISNETKIEISEDGERVTIYEDIDLSSDDIFIIYLDNLPIAYDALEVVHERKKTLVEVKRADDSAYSQIDEKGDLILSDDNSMFIPSDTVNELYCDDMDYIPSTYDASIQYKNGTFSYNSGNGLVLSLSDLRISHSVGNSGSSMAVKGSWSISNSITTNDSIAGNLDLISGEIRVLGVGVIRIQLDINAVAEMEGDISGSFCIGLSATDDGTAKCINQFTMNGKPSITTEMKLRAGIKISAGLDILVMHGFINGKIGIETKYTQEQHELSNGDVETCNDIRVYGYVTADYDVSYTGLDNLKVALTNGNIVDYSSERSPDKIVYHFEDGQLVRSCKYNMDVEDIKISNSMSNITYEPLERNDERILETSIQLPYDMELENLTINNNGEVITNGYNLIVDGDVNVCGGKLKVSRNSTLLINGNLNIRSGELINSGTIIVNGHTETGKRNEKNILLESDIDFENNGDFIINSSWDSARITIHGSGTTNLNHQVMNVCGDLIISGVGCNLDLNGGSVNISGMLNNIGNIRVNGGTINVEKDYVAARWTIDGNGNYIYQKAYSKLYMQTDTDILDIGGSFIIDLMLLDRQNVADASYNDITAGTIYVGRDIVQYNSPYLACSGTNLVVLTSANSKVIHKIHLESHSSKFNKLEAETNSEIVCDGYLGINTLMSDINLQSINAELVGIGQNKKNINIEGNILLESGTWDLDGGVVIVNGNFQNNSKLKINGGDMRIYGSYIGAAMTKNGDGSITYKECSSTLLMPTDNDLLEVFGDFIIYPSRSTSYQMEAGTLVIRQDLYQYGAYPLLPTGSNTIIFIPDVDNVVHMESSSSKFNFLKVERNSSIVCDGYFGVSTLMSNLEIKGIETKFTGIGQNKKDISITGTVILETNNTWDLNGGKVIINGDFQNRGILKVNGGHMIITGNYIGANMTENGDESISYAACNNTLNMTTDSDVLDIQGDFIIYPSNSKNYNQISAGILRINGNVYQYGSCLFAPSGTNAVVLNGLHSQKVIFENNTSKFNKLYLSKDVNRYTFIPDLCWKEIYYFDSQNPIFDGIIANGICGENIQWKLFDTGRLCIYGSGNMTSFDSEQSVPWKIYTGMITCVEIQENVKTIGAYSFANCEQLKEINLCSALNSIEHSSFMLCKALIEVKIPNGCVVEACAFYHSGLEKVTIGKNVTLGIECFVGTELHDIIYTGSVTANASIFKDCYNIRNIYISSIEDWCNSTFADVYSVPFALASVSKETSNSYNKSTNVYFGGNKKTEITIPDGIEYLPRYCFYGLQGIEKVIYSDSIKEVGWELEYSDVEHIVFGKNVTQFQHANFMHCQNLTKMFFTGDAPEFCDGGTGIFGGTFANITATVYYPSNNETWTSEVLKDYGGTITWVEYEQEYILGSGACGASVKWSFNNNGLLSITGTGSMKSYEYTKEVPWYPYINQITSVSIEDGVTNISDYAFYGLTKLKEIDIPASVKTIGEYAFKNNTGLERINLPKSLTKIGESAFFGCTSLKSITIPEGIYTIWGYTFKNCTSLASVSLPESLIKIDEAAFYGCSALTALVIPTECSIVGQYAFKNCSSLKNLTLPLKMTEIREAAFYATAVETLNIPSKVTKIGPYAFKNCTSLQTLNLPKLLTTIGESAFYGSSISYLNLPDAVTTIGAYAFKGCERLTEISFPANLITVGDSAFYYCTNLTEIELPDKLTTIEGYAFKNCTKLTSVILPDSLLTLGESAFYSCTKLPEITIPAKVTSVGAYCFSKDTGLKNITFLGNAPVIGASAFNNVTGSAYYPKGNSTWTASKKQNYGGTITWMER